MEILALIGVCLGIAIPVGSILGIVAFSRSKRLERHVERLNAAVVSLRNALSAMQTREHAEQQVKKESAEAPQAVVVVPQPPKPVPQLTEVDPVETARKVTPPPARAEMAKPVPRPPRASDPDRVENLIGRRLTWVGLGILFLGLVFFAKFAYDQGWFARVFPPAMRIASLLAVAIAMLGFGARLRATGLASMGESLLGGGLGVAYLAIFAGLSPKLFIIAEPLFSPTTAFLAMAAVTALGMTLAMALNARTVAIIAVIGGFVTPLLVSTGQNSRDALFAYILILDLGVLAVAFYRQWRVLDLITFAGTALLFIGWFDRYYGTYATLPNWGTLWWLGIFHLLFLGVAFAYHWRTHTALTLERFALVLGNLAWSLGYSAWILQASQKIEALICLTMALIYSTLGQRARRLEPRDGRVFHAFSAISIMLLTLAFLFQMPTDTVAAGWFVEAVVLLYLGYRWSYQPTRWCALIVLIAATVRALYLAEGHHEPFTFLLNPIFVKLALIPVGLAAFASVHSRFREQSSSFERIAKYICGCSFGLILLVELHYEISRYFDFSPGIFRSTVVGSLISFLWSAGAVGYLAYGRLRRDRISFCVGLFPLAVAAVASLALYVSRIHDLYLFWNLRFATAAVACAVGIAASYIARTGRDAFVSSQKSLYALTSVIQIGCFLFASIEIVAWNQSNYSGSGLREQMTTWMLCLLWLAGGLACMRYGRGIGSVPSIVIGLLAVAFASAGSLLEYAWSWPASLMYVNQRFVLCLAVVAGLALAAAWMRGVGQLREEWRRLPVILACGSVAELWLALSFEPASWFLTNLADHARAHRLATFSITLTWIVFASALLAIGFMRRIRVVRLTALSLLGATVVKILLIDMSGAQQLMRIASFIVTGVVLIAASYIYHRAEKFLETRGKSDDQSTR